MEEPKTAKTYEWQEMGGTFTIPDGWVVHEVNFDCSNPYAMILNEKNHDEEEKILIPKALAYYLSTHFCGSKVMRYTIQKNAIYNVGNTIKDALGW